MFYGHRTVFSFAVSARKAISAPLNQTLVNLNTLVAVLFLTVFHLRSAALAPDDFNANSKTAAATLQGWQNQRGLWDTTGWWNAANCVEALESVIAADNGQKYLPVLAHTFALNSRSNFINEYYDDEGWWALAWIHAYDLTGQPRYLAMAKTIFRDMTGGWGERCGGGLIWRKEHRYKNAIPNELFLLAAIRLHQRTPRDQGTGSYLEWAIREWEWFRNSGMINSHSLVNDGLNRRCENDGGTTWTYNQGVFIGGLTDLYKTTGDTNYLNEATAIADAAIATLADDHGVAKEPCEDRGCAGGDVPQFKGIFIRYLAYLYDETRNPAYRDFLLKNARSVWANDRDAANHLGLRWSGPFDQADAARHSSAMMAISALAEPTTKILPFAKGAGSVTFDHEVGHAAGNLAWSCDAANDRKASGMLSGTCASLAAGKHTAHFRLAIDELKNATNALVRLDVKTAATGATIARREISWNSFTATGQPQDFRLTLTNRTANTPLEIQVYWNNADHGPALTLSDVTIDGSHNWTAANLAHEIGRLDGLNGWEADSLRDRASGYLVKGPGANEFAAGKYSAHFELKVDDFSRDNSKVALLSVVETNTGKTIAARSVTRNQFRSGLYQTFTLAFEAGAGKSYDFRTYWHYAPDALRLTERSVVVEPR